MWGGSGTAEVREDPSQPCRRTMPTTNLNLGINEVLSYTAAYGIHGSEKVEGVKVEQRNIYVICNICRA